MSQTVSSFHVSFLWPGAGPARVECFACWRVSFSQSECTSASDHSLPRSDRPFVWMSDLADHIRREIESFDFHGQRLSQCMGATVRRRVRSCPRRVRRVMGRERLCSRPIASGATKTKTHDGINCHRQGQ